MNDTPLPELHTPLQWWSASALDSLSRRIEPVWRAWAKRWDLPAEPVESFNAHEAPASAPVEWQPWQADACAATPWAWVAVAQDTPAVVIAGLMFKHGNAGAIGAEVAGRAWGEFSDELASLLGRAPSAELPSFGGPRSAAWSGSVRVRLAWGPGDAPSLWLHLSADSVAPMLRDTRRPWQGHMAPITASVLGAMAHQPVTLRVELGTTELDLGTLQSLRVGDVLTLSHRLDAPLTLRPADAQAPVACAGYLGARNGRRAIEVVRSHGN